MCLGCEEVFCVCAEHGCGFYTFPPGVMGSEYRLEPGSDPCLTVFRAVYERVRMQLMGTTPETRQKALPQPLDDPTTPADTKSVIASLSNWKWSA